MECGIEIATWHSKMKLVGSKGFTLECGHWIPEGISAS